MKTEKSTEYVFGSKIKEMIPLRDFHRIIPCVSESYAQRK